MWIDKRGVTLPAVFSRLSSHLLKLLPEPSSMRDKLWVTPWIPYLGMTFGAGRVLRWTTFFLLLGIEVLKRESNQSICSDTSEKRELFGRTALLAWTRSMHSSLSASQANCYRLPYLRPLPILAPGMSKPEFFAELSGKERRKI